MDPVLGFRLRRTVDSRQASPSASGLADPSGRIEFLSYGPFACLRLLSTPPLSDAVSFDFDEERLVGQVFHLSGWVRSQAH